MTHEQEYPVQTGTVTFSLSSIWHSILDNFRPISVWGVDLVIFYFFTKGGFGEEWTKYSWLQFAGMFILIYSTAVYNGTEDGGSIPLKGQWFALGIDLRHEYAEVSRRLQQQQGS